MKVKLKIHENQSKHDLKTKSKSNEINFSKTFIKLKNKLSDLQQFLVTKSPLKIMQNALLGKALLVLKLFIFLFGIFCQVEKRLD